MTQIVPLKRAAAFKNDLLSQARPHLALEHLESWTGKMLDGGSLPLAKAHSSGVAAAETGDVLFGKLRPYLAKGMTVTHPIAASTELICMRAYRSAL